MGFTPTPAEQLLLQMINRARAAPEDEMRAMFATGNPDVNRSISAFGADEATAVAQVAGMAPLPPVAWNTKLALSADTHNDLMVQFDRQSHNLPGEPSLLGRIANAGFDFSLGGGAGENVYAYAEGVLHAHAGFYIDWGFGPKGIQNPPGHRDVILSTSFNHVGIALRTVPSGLTIGPFAVTQHFAQGAAEGGPFIVGVAIDDTDNDDFYDMGEGLGGVTVTATGAGGTFQTTTWNSGGYTLEVAPGSTYTVTFSGQGVNDSVSVRVNAQNVAVDVEKTTGGATTTPNQPSPAPAPSNGNDVIKGTNGPDAIDALGGNDILRGAGGADTLDGGDGNDRVVGGGGNDRLTGGPGNDRVGGQAGSDSLLGAAGDDTVRGATGNDTLSGGAGDDKLNGQIGRDVLFGDGGNDTLKGGPDNDTLSGGGGNDRLKGGSGSDQITGGAGRDIFHVDHHGAASDGDVDTFTDFVFGVDLLVFEAWDGHAGRRIESLAELNDLTLSGLSLRQVGNDARLDFTEAGTTHSVILEGIDLFA